jgi:hypothetical protein
LSILTCRPEQRWIRPEWGEQASWRSEATRDRRQWAHQFRGQRLSLHSLDQAHSACRDYLQFGETMNVSIKRISSLKKEAPSFPAFSRSCHNTPSFPASALEKAFSFSFNCSRISSAGNVCELPHTHTVSIFVFRHPVFALFLKGCWSDWKEEDLFLSLR